MLTRIHIDNYKCLTNFDLRLHNLTLLAGANGCGKSAVFEVMGKLRDFACDQRVDKLFLADDLTRWTTKREQRFELEFSTDGGVFIYELVTEYNSEKRGAEIAGERLLHDGKPILSSCDRKLQVCRDDDTEGPVYPFGRFRSALATDYNERVYSRLHRFRGLVSGFQTLSLAPSLMQSGSKTESDVLAHDGANFAAWYRAQILNDPHQLQQITNRLSEILPGFAGLKLSARVGDYRELLATFSAGNDDPSHSYRFHQLSDGQRALMVLYALVFETIPDTGSPDDSGNVPRTLFLDEPDNYVTLPELQPWLADIDRAKRRGAEAVAGRPPRTGPSSGSSRRWAVLRAEHEVVSRPPRTGPSLRARIGHHYHHPDGFGSATRLPPPGLLDGRDESRGRTTRRS